MLTDVLGEILTSLDLVVLERLPDGVLLRLGSSRAPAGDGEAGITAGAAWIIPCRARRCRRISSSGR